MIYKSNLMSPDCLRNFKHLISRPMAHSFGHNVQSDWSDLPDDHRFAPFKQCGSWTDDERAILAAYAAQLPMQSLTLDIGSHTGVTAKVLNWMTNAPVLCVDYMLADYEFRTRFLENTGFPSGWIIPNKSEDYFAMRPLDLSGVWMAVIDGDHDAPAPLNDAIKCAKSKIPLILFHDGLGDPVQRAVLWLLRVGYTVKAYLTPHIVFACWKNELTRSKIVGVTHVPDPWLVSLDLPARMPLLAEYMDQMKTW